MSVNEFQQWLAHIARTECPDQSIIAYYFGIFEGETNYTVYLTGTTSYDPEDADWASNNDFEPANKYFVLPYACNQTDWSEILEIVSTDLKGFVASALFAHSFLSQAQAIATGFDEGELVEIFIADS